MMKLSRRTTLSAGIAATALQALPARSAESALGAAVDSLCSQSIAGGQAAGIAVEIVHAGKPLHSKGYGLANLETRTSVVPQTVFRIGSVTKQFTAASILLLAEDGKLSLGDPLARFVPEFPRAGEVTVRQLLNHTSGIANITRGVIPCLDYSTDQLIKIIESQVPLFAFDPGTHWAYSNTGLDLAGAIIERITGRPFGEFFRERLYPAANMIATQIDRPADIVTYRASGYAIENGSFINAPHLSWTIPAAAGALRSTAVDLAHWHTALFGRRILKPASLHEMTTPSRLKDGRLASLGRNGPAAGTRPDQEYGLGLEISKVKEFTRIGHYGAIQGFAADMGTFPELGLTVVVLTNTDLGPQNPPRGLDGAVVRHTRP